MASIDLNDLIEKLSDTANPIMYQYFLNLAKRTIILNQEVTENIVEEVILPLIQMDNDGTGEEITIYLNTCGGSVYNGLCLCDVISKLKTPTKIIVLGYAYSMGSLFLMSAFNNPNVKTYCHRFSTALIHGGSSYVEGTASQVKDYFNFNNKFEEKIKEFMLSNSKITEDLYERMDRTEWYMNSDDMVKYGLIDEII